MAAAAAPKWLPQQGLSGQASYSKLLCAQQNLQPLIPAALINLSPYNIYYTHQPNITR